LFAGLAKALGSNLHSGWGPVLMGWPLWVLLLAGATTLSLAWAFQAGAASAAITTLFTVEPLAGIAVGDAPAA
jgi:hypothetical protein